MQSVSIFLRSLKDWWKTFLLFTVATWFIPILFINFIVLALKRKLIYLFLKLENPSYLFANTVKIRNFIETHRNPGIYHILIKVEGKYNLTAIKQHVLETVIEKRNKHGDLQYPRLRMNLVKKFNQYAWDTKTAENFDIDKHIVFASDPLKRNLQTENRVQEYINELVTKYMSIDQPPWQLVIVPAADTVLPGPSTDNDEEKVVNNYYVLLRIHHMLVAEEKQLRLNDLLLLNATNSLNQQSPLQKHLNEDFIHYSSFSLLNFIDKPTHIPQLYNRIIIHITNRWNEFIYKYDPLDSYDGDKNPSVDCITQLMSMCLIAIVTVVGDFYKGYHATKPTIQMKFKYLKNLIRREVNRRNLSFDNIINSIKYSLHPWNLVKNSTVGFFYLIFMCLCNGPYLIIRELRAIRNCIILGHSDDSDSISSLVYEFVPLIWGAIGEFITISKFIISAPRMIVDELFENSVADNKLKYLYPCGRKCVAWSDEICNDDVNLMSEQTNLPQIAIIFTAITSALRDFFIDYNQSDKLPVPKAVNASIRSTDTDYFMRLQNHGSKDFLTITLPLPAANDHGTQWPEIEHNMAHAREHHISLALVLFMQRSFGLITKCLPGVFVHILFKYFSKKYPIIITYMERPIKNNLFMGTQEVNDVMFFQAPPLNSSITINIQRYGNNIRLCSMADHQLHPYHSKITSSWKYYMIKH